MCIRDRDKRGQFVQFEDQWNARHILLIPSAIRSDDETKSQLQEIRQRVMDGEDFALLAEEFSEDPGSAKNWRRSWLDGSWSFYTYI